MQEFFVVFYYRRGYPHPSLLGVFDSEDKAEHAMSRFGKLNQHGSVTVIAKTCLNGVFSDCTEVKNMTSIE